MKSILLCSLFLFFSFSLQAQTLYRYCENGKTGYIDSSGKVMIVPQYERGESFGEGYCAVKVNGKYGYINKQNKLVIEPQFENAFMFSQGTAIVMMDGHYGVINTRGTMIIPAEFDGIENLQEGAYIVQKKNLYGAFDVKGHLISSPVYYSMSCFSAGLARVGVDAHHWGYMDKNGHMKITARYYGISGNFSEGRAAVYDSSGCYFIDTDGKMCINKKFAWANCFSEGLAFVLDERGKPGYFIDVNGNDVFKGKRFKRAWEFSKGICGLETDTGFVVINKKGEIVFQSKHYEVIGHYGNFLVFTEHGGSGGIGIMNHKFQVIGTFRFCESQSVPVRYMEVRLMDKDGCTNHKAHISPEGKVLVKWEEEQ